jgi:predicted ribosome quality control (RQC) complex YloA/Tae2 family protein
LTVVFFLAFLSKGCTNSKISKLEKKYSEETARLESKIDSLQKQADQTATAKEVRDQMEVVMFNYLIYEDDLDKGKSSLSDVKNKIESND